MAEHRSDACVPVTVEISTEKARAAIIALTELRGWAGASPQRERDYMLPRIDLCADVFGIADVVRSAHHDVLEGVRAE